MPLRSWWFPTWVGNARYAAGGPMLGNSVSAVISKTMDRAGVPGTPHALRHWFGTALRAEGVDSLVIKELMGHERNLSTWLRHFGARFTELPPASRLAG